MRIRTVRRPQPASVVYTIVYRRVRDGDIEELRGLHQRRPRSRDEALRWGRTLAATLRAPGCEAWVREGERVIARYNRVEGWTEVGR